MESVETRYVLLCALEIEKVNTSSGPQCTLYFILIHALNTPLQNPFGGLLDFQILDPFCIDMNQNFLKRCFKKLNYFPTSTCLLQHCSFVTCFFLLTLSVDSSFLLWKTSKEKDILGVQVTES